MRPLLILLIGLLGACQSKEERLRVEYFAALERYTDAYFGSDPKFAYEQTVAFIEHVKNLEKAGARIPAQEIYVWDNARLGLLAEHLQKKEEASRLFALAAANSRKTHGEIQGMSAEQLRAALEQMDTPAKVGWKKK